MVEIGTSLHMHCIAGAVMAVKVAVQVLSLYKTD